MACGFHVFPMLPGAAPADVRRWSALATDDAALISRWDHQWPCASVGVALGERSDALVLEVAAEGFATLYAFAARGRHVPKCPISRRTNGTLHLWFRNVSGVLGSDDGHAIAPGLRVLSDGCHVMAPPSAPAVGNAVWWVTPPSEVRPPALPDWLVAMVAPTLAIAASLREHATMKQAGAGQ